MKTNGHARKSTKAPAFAPCRAQRQNPEPFPRPARHRVAGWQSSGKTGMKAKSKEFVEKGAEVYPKA